MPKIGDYFESVLKETHMNWGIYRKTKTRGKVEGEAYIKIPSKDAKRLEIYNSNYGEGLGINVFHCTSVDGNLNSDIKMAGSAFSDDIYAKNLQGNGDLKIIGNWFKAMSAQPGDKVIVKWVTKDEVSIELIKQ